MGGTNAFSFNPFDAPSELTGAPRNGWHGEYRTGGLIFLPGNSLHHVRNKCANTVAINVRPWLHSIARKAASLHGLPIPFSTRDSRARYCYCSSATHRSWRRERGHLHAKWWLPAAVRTGWYMCATEEVAFKPAVYASTFLRYGSGSTENKAARPISAWISVSFRVWCVCSYVIAFSCVDPKRPATPHVAYFTAP